MKTLGYGAGYRYAHDSPDAYQAQEYLPGELRGQMFYVPGTSGYEKRIAERMAWWAERKQAESPGTGTGGVQPTEAGGTP
jgi:putative ATPase